MGKENLLGLMENIMMDSGKIARWMDLENMFGRMEKCMKGFTKMIKSMVKVNSMKEMVEFFKVNGLKVKDPGKVKYG